MLAHEFAKKLFERRSARRGALVIALSGELGSGKTTFVQGFARGLGVTDKVLSPTFVIVRCYRTPGAAREIKRLYHVDCWRIRNEKEMLELGWSKMLSDAHGAVLVEWPERIRHILPPHAMFLSFKVTKENERIISFEKS